MPPRVPPRTVSEASDTGEVQEIKAGILGIVPNSALTIARWPELARAYGHMSQATRCLRYLSPDLRNLIFLIASTAAGCRYCQAHSAGVSLRHGMSVEKLEAAWNFETSPLFDEAERAALSLALAAGAAPPTVTDDHFVELRKHYEDDAIVEIVGVIAWSGFMNRWNSTMATELEDSPREAAMRHLPGWEPGPHVP